MLKLSKLILLVPVTNAVSERLSSTLRRAKTYLRSSITQEHLSSCLILASYKEQEDKRNLVEVANQCCFKNEYHFSIKNTYFSMKFSKSAAKGTQTSNKW